MLLKTSFEHSFIWLCHNSDRFNITFGEQAYKPSDALLISHCPSVHSTRFSCFSDDIINDPIKTHMRNVRITHLLCKGC